jgi:hypothetical protein
MEIIGLDDADNSPTRIWREKTAEKFKRNNCISL